MKLLLTPQVLKQLELEMRQARRMEIGGLLFGEHVGADTFRVVDITVQRSGGSPVHFVRDPAQHRPQLDAFFRKTGAEYTKFNYLGEWHTHPSFEPHPSGQDVNTMQSIVEDPAVGVNFLVLLIPRLKRWRHIEVGATLFRPSTDPSPVELSVEGASEALGANIFSWIQQLFVRK
jgi:integrative and conjugative element protein (TIGR02256 family)